MKTWFPVVALILLFASGITHAEVRDDGNELLRGCTVASNASERKEAPTTLDAAKKGYCLGLVKGVTDTVSFYQTTMGGACIPDAVTLGQEVRIVVKFLNDHPEALHERDSLLVIRAMSKAFPCK